MPTLLAVTVGGACTPIVTAIRDYSADHVCFIASAGPKGSLAAVQGEGDPCGDKRQIRCPHCGKPVALGDPHGPNIIAQAGLRPDQYTLVEVADPDSLSDCYRQIRAALESAAASRPDWRRLADYTGGTKTMTIALANAALELGWELSAVKGTRADLIKVLDGSEMAGLVNVADLRAQQRLAEARRLFNGFAYEAAGEQLESLLREAPLSSSLQMVIREQVALCRAFDAWDRFDHVQARHLLKPYRERVSPQFDFLLKLTGDDRRATGYEPVIDLLNNAERRAERGRYDDAVARLYRALELFAQLRLRYRTPSLDTSNLPVEQLPSELQPRYLQKRGPAGKVALALVDSYGLLADLQDPLSAAYASRREKLLGALEMRNYSILAHGLKPLSRNDYDAMADRVKDMIQAGLAALGLTVGGTQFPRLEPHGIVQR